MGNNLTSQGVQIGAAIQNNHKSHILLFFYMNDYIHGWGDTRTDQLNRILYISNNKIKSLQIKKKSPDTLDNTFSSF